MKRLDKKTVKGFVTGVLASVLAATTIAPAAASTLREIRVAMGGIQIYVDGNLKKPTDANGNVVEPMIYNGTTYLPVRAVTGMLTDKEVSWDGNKQIVYIGKKPESGGESVALDTLEPYEKATTSVNTGKDAAFTVLGEAVTPFNRMHFMNPYRGISYIIYKLDSKYKSLNGKFTIAYDSLGTSSEYALQFYNVDQYGEETLIKEYTTKCGDTPVDVSVPVTGCNFVKIYMDRTAGSKNNAAYFYDVTLTTAE